MILKLIFSFMVVLIIFVGTAFAQDDILKVQIINEDSGFDWTMIATVVGIFTAIGGLIFSILKGAQESAKSRETQEQKIRAQFAEMLSDFEEDLQLALIEITKLLENASKEKCHRVVSDYLNVLDKIAYLRNNDMINNKLIDYFDWFFSLGLRYIWWKNQMFTVKNAEKKWPHQIEWCNKDRNKNRISIAEEKDMNEVLKKALTKFSNS